MLNYRSTLMGGSPPCYGPPKNSTDPELVMRHHRSAQGRYGGICIVTSFITPVLRISYHSNNISRANELFFSLLH
jgi:hypothetical protein